MNEDFKNEREMFGLEEINQTEKSDVNGGNVKIHIEIPIFCYWNIPPMDPFPC